MAEVRAARVVALHAPDRKPAFLPAGCDAVKASLRTASGARVSVVLGGPPDGEFCCMWPLRQIMSQPCISCQGVLVLKIIPDRPQQTGIPPDSAIPRANI